MMFCGLSVMPTLPVANLERAKQFYADKLGLQPAEELPGGGVMYRCNGSRFGLYPSEYAGTAKNTAAVFETDDLERDVKELRGKGVVFEEYNFPQMKTVNGIIDSPGGKSAWFKDSEGNIIALGQRMGPQ
jgi:catechol 2,3-dioxygenase-like lactoylglutathione lyase family enzyme